MATKREQPAGPQTIISDLLFPGRTVLNLTECSAKLGVSKQHLLDLIDEGVLGGINIGNGKVKHYRIPVKEWERFLASRSSV